MNGSQAGRLVAALAVLSLVLAGCELADSDELNPSSSPTNLALPATYSGNGVLTMTVSGWGNDAQRCSASGTATIAINGSGYLVLSVRVAGLPEMGPLGECTTQNGTAATKSASASGITTDETFDFEKCGDASLSPFGTGRFPGSGPDATSEIVAHVECTGPEANYTLDATVMR
jgi:hypothetical protein